MKKKDDCRKSCVFMLLIIFRVRMSQQLVVSCLVQYHALCAFACENHPASWISLSKVHVIQIWSAWHQVVSWQLVLCSIMQYAHPLMTTIQRHGVVFKKFMLFRYGLNCIRLIPANNRLEGSSVSRARRGSVSKHRDQDEWKRKMIAGSLTFSFY